MSLPDKALQALRLTKDVAGAAALSTSTLVRRRRSPRRASGRVSVHFLVEGDPRRGLSPAARYRALQFIPLLEKRGIRCVVHPSRPAKYFSARAGFQTILARFRRPATLFARVQHWRQTRNRLRDFARSAGDGVVFVQRDLLALSHNRVEDTLPLFNRRIVFDFDDAIFTSPSWSNTPGQKWIDEEMRAKIARICELSCVVITANSYLAGFAREHNDNVHVLPTVLCTDEFRPVETPTPEARPVVRPVVGWVGTSGNLYYLRKVAPAFRELARTRDFVLRVVCNRVPDRDLPDLPAGVLDFVEWDKDCEVERIQRFDVGIMPLVDDEWTRGKAGFKLVQYMACGVPFVFSPVGANPDVAGPDGLCGLAAREVGDWSRALGRLLDDPALRARLGRAGRVRAVERFDRRRTVAELAAILEGVASDA